MSAPTIEQIGQPAVEVDPSLQIVRCNQGFREAFALGPGVGPGDSIVLLIPDQGLEGILLRALRSTEPLLETDFIWSADTATERTFMLSASRFTGARPGLLLTFFDVTEWKARQRDVMEAVRLVSMGEMVAGLTHEINNPLAAIMGLSQLALTEDLEPRVRTDIEKILEQAKRASDIVGDVRAFVGGLQPAPGVVDLPSIVESVLEKRTVWIKRLGVSVLKQFDADLPPIEGDAKQLAKALDNVVTNALQAVAEAGREPEIAIKVRADKTNVRLSIADNGPGIGTEDLNRIFDPFYSTRGVGRGVGLGLSVSHRIIHEHKGSIRAHSGDARGSTFAIELPAYLLAAKSETPQLDEGVHASVDQLSVLVVEDEQVVAETLARILGDLGHSVDMVSRAEQVFGRTDLGRYDVIAMDIKLPDLSGEALFHYLHQLPDHVYSRVLFITGDTASTSTQQSVRRSGLPVLTKPFTVDELSEAIRRSRTNPRRDARPISAADVGDPGLSAAN